MKKLKIAILAIAVVASISGALATKKRAGQWFYIAAYQPSVGTGDIEIAMNQDEPNPIAFTCSGGNAPWICRILTTAGPTYYQGDRIPRTDFIITEMYYY